MFVQMAKKYADDYIEELIRRQNDGAEIEQQNLYSREDYAKLIYPVLSKILSDKTGSKLDIMNELHRDSHIDDLLSKFILDRGMAPGTVVGYSIPGYTEYLTVGNRQEVALKDGELINSEHCMNTHTLFDLAACSTIFTQVAILKLVEEGQIELDAPITEYVPEFKNLNNVSIMDLLGFTTQLKTTDRIDRAANKTEAKKILMGIEVDVEANQRPYSDLAPMVLKVVVESVTGLDIYKYLQQTIFEKYRMVNTYDSVPINLLNRTASTNFSCNYYQDGNVVVRSDAYPGVVYDPKAQKLRPGFVGHAGLFSSTPDMLKFANAMSNYEILSKDTLDLMAKNTTGKKIVDENGNVKFIQYCNALGYSKNPVLPDSEVYHALSGQAFANAGFNGTQLTIDPTNKLNLFVGSNRTHNRMTFIAPNQRDKVKVDENGRKTILLPNGREMIDATRFAWDRDEFIVHPALKLAMQYKFLDDFYRTFKKEECMDEVRGKTYYLNTGHNFTKFLYK